MIDKSCGYKMASESESDSSSHSSLHNFLQKIEDVVRLFHRIPASEAGQAARALRSIADRLCVAVDGQGAEPPAEPSARPAAASAVPTAGSLSLPPPQSPAPLPLPKDVALSSVLSALTNRLDVDKQTTALRGPKRSGDGRRRLQGKGGVPKPALPPQQQATTSSSSSSSSVPAEAAAARRAAAASSSAVAANSCSHCGKQFSCAAKLVEHRRTHTGERPFVCQICNRAFSVKSNMTRHVVDTHGLKDAAVGRCGRRARPSVARSSSSSSSNSHAAPLPPLLRCADDSSDVELEPHPTHLAASAPSPPPPKIARHHQSVMEGLMSLHRLNRRKSQPRKLDSVIDSLHDSMPCTVDDTEGVEDQGSGSRDIGVPTAGELTTKQNGKHSLDVDMATISAADKPVLQLQDVSNGPGRREELWLSCDRGFRQASPY